MRVESLVSLVPALAENVRSIRALDGGVTNRNFRVDAGGASYVFRVAGEASASLGIDRALEHDCAQAAARAGVGPEVIAYIPEQAVLVTRFVDGHPLTPQLGRERSILQRVTESIRRYHRGGAVQGRFSPFETVRSYYARARHECVAFPGGLGLALALLERVEALLPRGTPIGPCHNDLLPANLIDDGRQIWIIDWEYAGLGDPFFDLGNLAANLELSEEQERALLETYSGEIRENDLRHLRLMRLASDMREALWGFLQSGISTLDFDFFAYGSQHLDRFLGAASYLDSLPDSRPPASQP